MKIFLVGPGGAGKSTVGKILANKLGVACIDLDKQFMTSVGHISQYITREGYLAYKKANSELAHQLLRAAPESYVFVASSGFLVHEEYRARHLSLLAENGLLVLLMPSENRTECEEIIVKRQLNRGFGLDEDNERKKIRERFVLYQKLGDIQVFSYESPEVIVDTIYQRIKAHVY